MLLNICLYVYTQQISESWKRSTGGNISDSSLLLWISFNHESTLCHLVIFDLYTKPVEAFARCVCSLDTLRFF